LAYPLLRKGFGSAVVVACFWGGCYTDPINMRPTVRIDAPLEPISWGVPVTYKATASDPDGDPLRPLQWVLQAAELGCPNDFDAPGNWPTTVWSEGKDLTLFSKDTKARFCVWVKAIDAYGAASVDARTGDPQDHSPVAVIELVDPPNAASFAAHTTFRLSAETSTDPDMVAGDSLTPTWTLLDPLPTPTAKLVECSAMSNPFVRCLTADVPGDYQVQLSVSDDSMMESIVERTLRVQPGQLPTAEIDLVSPTGSGPYPLGSELRVSGMHSTGAIGDDWQALEPPMGSTAVLGDCAVNQSMDARCFVADKAGSYRVTLKVHNETGDSAPVSATYVVAPDQPPCLDNTTPDLGVTMTSMTTFTVNVVSDDFDPIPAAPDMSTTTVQWFTKTANDSSFALAAKGFPNFSLTSFNLSFGDVVRVRLEIGDRDTDRSAKAFLACGDADTCSLPSLIHPDTCLQRVTWTVHILP
jgi:hypothetical protein